MTPVRTAHAVVAGLSLVVGIGLLVLTVGDGVVIGERGPRLGAFVNGNLLAALVFVLGGLIAAAGAIVTNRIVTTAAAVVLLGGAAVHLIGILAGTDLLGGSGSTVSAWLGLGGAVAAIALADPERLEQQTDADRSDAAAT